MNVSSVERMRANDRRAIEQYGIPELLLMEHAGMAALAVMARQYPLSGQRWLVVCGSGNNGGDGLVVARLLHSRGADAVVRLVGDPARYGEAAAANYQIVQQMGLDVAPLDAMADFVDLLSRVDGVVDGLLGTGLSRAVSGRYAEVIDAINASGKPVVSLDIPSGINGDTGQVMGVAIQARQTVTFGLPKTGNLLFPGYAHQGALYVSHIGFPPALSAASDAKLAVNEPVALPPRNPDGHKGSFGDTLFVAGAAAYYGAPYFAAMAFMRAGGGYARLATPRSVAPVIAAHAAELVYMPQDETAAGTLAASAGDGLLDALAGLDFAVIGPGTSREPETQELLRRLAREAPTPTLVDGDGLTAISADLETIRQRAAPTVLTPHLGEMARLTGLSIGEITQDRIGVLQRTSADLNAVIVLKGAHSLIGYPDGRVFVNLTGNAGMATAGSGDVLAGMIAAAAGLGLPFDEAVRAGVALHGFAGDIAAGRVGQDGTTAETILDAVPEALQRARTEADWFAPYRLPTV